MYIYIYIYASHQCNYRHAHLISHPTPPHHTHPSYSILSLTLRAAVEGIVITLVSSCSGETAFFTMQYKYGWAIRPMMSRLISDLTLPISLIYGVRSWMDNSTGERIREGRPDSYVDVHYIRRAGHHLHVEQPEEFNRVINQVCSLVDRNADSKPILLPASGSESTEEEIR